MVVSDSRLHDVVRPTFLTFEGDLEPGEPFAHMIENGPLLAALVDKAKQEGVALRSSAVTDVSPSHSTQGASENSRRAGCDIGGAGCSIAPCSTGAVSAKMRNA